MISPFANTYAVFQVLLNYSDRENANIPWHQQKNLGSVFKAAGYQTFWLDAQDDLENNPSFSLWSYPFDKRYWSNGPTDVPNASLDEWLIKAFNERAKSQLGAKNFLLFHLFGSHAGYKLENKDLFSPKFGTHRKRGYCGGQTYLTLH
ncbi:hypothetical protein NHP21005_16070 [Helicobacter sp. NHP21005]|uniref:sulfatase-like hydrolase/transferase n=1 Tax=Helicobacter felistomachi TaxID=3040201 RepID=UPI0025726374|nr:sulfatase-like hydrolase/transferase [Helicobacter sp. NHP21005]BEG57919.1 hypothetical protein NHP21005_16070 [Helicobacter sp. NHP21005]